MSISGEEGVEQAVVFNGPEQRPFVPISQKHSLGLYTINQLLAQSFAENADRIAIEEDGKTWTYTEIDYLSTQLAYTLIDLKLNDEEIVAVHLNKNAWLIVSIIAILKAGHPFFLLNPEFPISYRAKQLKLARAKVLVTDKLGGCDYPHLVKNIIYVEQEYHKKSILLPTVFPKKLAYLIFTSGSTDEPKGILVEHASIANTILNCKRLFKIKENHRVLIFSNVNFDAFILDTLLALVCGATHVIVKEEELLPGEVLNKTLRKYKINFVTLTPSVMNVTSPNHLPQLNTVICAGEKCCVEVMEKWGKNRCFINAYGPAEASVCATTYECSSKNIYIGKPISNVLIYILDKYLRPVSSGIVGEMYIGGIGLCRGYLDAALGKEAFIINPFSGGDDRLYKTGDLAKWMPDGNIEYIGRKDNQVKINGCRIELSEIENALRSITEIANAAVVCRKNHSQDQLIAYYLVQNQKQVHPEFILSSLQKKLPKYMIPSEYIQVDSFPLLASGKVDHVALVQLKLKSHGVRVMPSTKMEEQLCALWGKYLEIKEFGVTDNFFKLGGHSLLAMVMLGEINKKGYRISIKDFYANSTIRKLAEFVTTINKKDKHDYSKLPTPPKESIRQSYELGVRNAYPLSSLQQGILLNCLSKRNINLYAIQLSFRLLGAIDINTYVNAWEKIIARHDILRVKFLLDSVDNPIQIIEKEAKFKFSYCDLRDSADLTKEIALSAILKKDAKEPFELNIASLMRINLIRLEEEEYCFIWTFHHIIMDARSTRIILDEFNAIYDAILLKKRLELPPARSFFKYITWLANIDFYEVELFWRQYLTGFDLPTIPGFMSPLKSQSITDAQFAEIDYIVDERIRDRIVDFQKEHSVTFSTLVNLAWAVILRVFSLTDDVVFGVNVSNRGLSIENMHDMVGLIESTVPLRVTFNNNESIIDLLIRTQTNIFDVLSNSVGISLTKIRETTNITSNVGLFDTLLTVSDDDFYFRDLNQGEQFAYTDRKTKLVVHYPINLSVFMGEQIHIKVLYNSARVKSEFAKKIPGFIEKLLSDFTGQPNKKIQDVSVITTKEKYLLLDQWQGKKKEINQQSLIKMFEQQVINNSQKSAIIFKDEAISYAYLNVKANKLAKYLLSVGVKYQSQVGVFLERSPEAVICCLAILKIGAIYVPIDPQLPQNRINAMLDSLDLSAILLRQCLKVKLEETPVNSKIIDLDTNWYKILSQDPKNLNLEFPLDCVFNILFTSGSTGRPKGVAITVFTVLNLVLWFGARPNNAKIKKISQFANLGFDASLFEFFYALCFGKELHIVPSEVKRSISDFVKFVKENKLNQVFLPTILLAHFSEEVLLRKTKLDELMEILVAGEELIITSNIKKFFLLHQHVLLLNCYGPTESHIVTVHQLPLSQSVWDSLVSIGKPLWNTRLYVLDHHKRLLPAGARGELYIAGPVVAKGYIGSSEIEKERFIPDTFDEAGSGLMYKTGDIVEWEDDGSLKFFGRVDNQVKMSGYRVELTEIEALLSTHPSVKYTCVILDPQKEPDDKKLIAYVIFHESSRASPLELHKFLSEHIPPYMLPVAYVEIGAFPLNQNGKINKSMLPDPDNACYPNQMLSMAPRNEVEIALYHLWSKLLGVKSYGIHDNFFDLGGNSLLALRLQSEISKHFLLDISIDDLLHAPTIAESAEIIKQLAGDRYIKENVLLIKLNNRSIPSSIVKLKKGYDRISPLFLVHPIGGTAFGFVHLAKYLDIPNSIYAIQDPGIEAGEFLFESIEKMAEFYVSSIMRLVPDGPYHIAGASFGANIAVEMARQLRAMKKPVGFIGLLDGWRTYPGILGKNNKSFQEFMHIQFEKIKDEFATFGGEFSNMWIELQKNRIQLLLDYKTPMICQEAILFKAMEILPFLQDMDEPTNHWSNFFQSTLEVIKVPGNHETMFEKPYVIRLAEQMTMVLKKQEYKLNTQLERIFEEI